MSKPCFCGHKVDTLRMRLDAATGSYLCVTCDGQILAPIDTPLGQAQRFDILGDLIESHPVGSDLLRGGKR